MDAQRTISGKVTGKGLRLYGTKPYQEGYSDGELAAQEMDKHQLRFSRAATLGDLATDYVFFNHGAFLSWSEMPFDPLADIVQKSPDPLLLPMLMEFSSPILEGAAARPEDRLWEHCLIAVTRDKWPDLYLQLKEVGAIDRSRQRYHRVTDQEVRLVDPLAMDKLAVLPSPIPTVPVTLFGIDGTHHHRKYAVAIKAMGPSARLLRFPPRPITLVFAQALFSACAKPYDAIDQDPTWLTHQQQPPPQPPLWVPPRAGN